MPVDLCLIVKSFSESWFSERKLLTLRCLIKGSLKSKEYEIHKEIIGKEFAEAAMCFRKQIVFQ